MRLARDQGSVLAWHSTILGWPHSIGEDVLNDYKEAGRWERHRVVGQKLATELSKLGFQPLVKNSADRIWHLTVVLPPSHLDEAKLRDRLMNKYGIEIGGGLGKLAGKILRIGTMGPLASEAQVEFLLDAIASSS